MAYWPPIAAVAVEPVIWVDALAERHSTSVVYAGSATTALALSFVVSRTAKHFIHRARSCTDEGPTVVSFDALTDTTSGCGRRSGVRLSPWTMGTR